MSLKDSFGNSLRRVAFIGNYLPRQCGIATFTTDLCEAIAEASDKTNCFAIAVTDNEEGYDYPPRVRLELIHQDILSYRRAADFLNLSDVDTICLQHEFGIYGGPAGSHILTLLREVTMPVVTTLHTVLEKPDPIQFKVMREIAQRSDRLVVMSQRAVDYLQTIYQVPAEKIDFIPHGIPDVSFVDPNFYKDKFGVEGRTTLLTFGLLSPNKGIENMIRALPAIKAKHPDVIYLVLGSTHPHVRRNEGERYRDSLKQLAHELNVEDNVRFIDQFVTLNELVEYIGAADIYVTPYLNREQIVSGTLAYAVGAGKAVVSTPYWYAEEVLAEEQGVLTPFGDPDQMAEKILYILEHETERHAMRKRAYLYGRAMIWPEVASRYLESFKRAREEHMINHRSGFNLTARGTSVHPLPAPNLRHVLRMTDDTGMLQHAVFTVPNYSEGYTTDDNARALGLTVLLEELGAAWDDEAHRLAPRYLAFLWHAFNAKTRRFRNFLGYDRYWLETIGSADSHGRALQNLGLVIGRSEQDDLRGVAIRLFEEALPAALDLDSPRAWAFTLIGLHEYLNCFSGDRRAYQALSNLAERLFECYQRASSESWPWFEESLTYSNAVLAHAMMVSGQRLGRAELFEVGLNSLRWLVELQRTEAGHFAPIGCCGFYPRDGEQARFDQQPVETQTLVSACLEASRLTGDPYWHQTADWAFSWFLGQNDLGTPIYDENSGGCHDGLHSDRVNQNQGAESSLAFLLALLELRQAQTLLTPLVRSEALAPTLLQLPNAPSSMEPNT